MTHFLKISLLPAGTISEDPEMKSLREKRTNTNPGKIYDLAALVSCKYWRTIEGPVWIKTDRSSNFLRQVYNFNTSDPVHKCVGPQHTYRHLFRHLESQE